MTVTVGYNVMIGKTTIRSAGPMGALVGHVVVERGMESAAGRCRVLLAGPEPPEVARDDRVTIELSVGESSAIVFTGQVDFVEAHPTGLWATASDGLALLSRCDVSGSYEDSSIGYIVKDLLSQAGATAGSIEEGATLGSHTVHRGPRALAHVQHLARLLGADLFTDGSGAVQIVVAGPGAAEHRFVFGETVLDLHLVEHDGATDGAEVFGEGAAGTKGAEKAHWLTTDLSGVSGSASVKAGKVASGSAGERSILVVDGALRSAEAAQTCADGQAKALAARPLRGYLEVQGAPAVEPGQRVAVDGLPDVHAAVLQRAGVRDLRVRQVRHTLDRSGGFITRMEF